MKRLTTAILAAIGFVDWLLNRNADQAPKPEPQPDEHVPAFAKGEAALAVFTVPREGWMEALAAEVHKYTNGTGAYHCVSRCIDNTNADTVTFELEIERVF